MESSTLKAQMNPHFIFNTLNGIQSVMILKGEKKANEYISIFSKMLRKTLEISFLESMSLQEELDYINSFIVLQNIRHKNPIAFHVDIAPGLTSKERMQNKVFIDKDQINYLSQSITEVKTSNFVIVSGMDKVDFLNPDEIICLKSSGRYTQFILKDAARQVVSSKSIGEYEDTLSKTAFFRIHNSYLINLSHIVSIDKKGGTYCTLSNGSVLPISRRRYDGLMRLFRDK